MWRGERRPYPRAACPLCRRPHHCHVHCCSGKLINPHNPEFITKRPWYLGESGPSLKHHAKRDDGSTLSMSETDQIIKQRKKFLGVATKYRKVGLTPPWGWLHKSIADQHC
jgi:hypothetical protein